MLVILLYFYILEFPRNKPSKTVMVGPGQFIVLNDSASPKMFMKFFFSKVSKMFECPRGDSHITADRNFIRFA